MSGSLPTQRTQRTSLRISGLARSIISALLLASALGSSVTAAAQTTKADRQKQKDIADLQAAAQAAERRDCPAAVKVVAPLVDRKPDHLPPIVLAGAYQLAAFCELMTGKQADAYRHALAGSALPDSSDDLWRLRLELEVEEGRLAAAVTTIEAMSQGRGAALNGERQEVLYRLDRLVTDARDLGLRRRLLAVLVASSYVPDKPMDSADGFRLRYAGLLSDAGDQAGMRVAIADIADPGVLRDIALDKRLSAALPAGFDLRHAVERALAETRAVAERNPTLIRPVLQTAAYLRVLGRPAEALKTLDAIEKRIGVEGAFGDAAEQTIWWWDERGRAYSMLGRHDEELAALRKGGEEKENGGLNVSQVINLAQTQVDIGRPADALATLAVFDSTARDTSPFGAMQVRYTRACANSLLGKPEAAAADAAFVRAHEKDAPGTVTELLLCLGDIDGAAASFVRRLDDPERRVAALSDLSDYDAPPVSVPSSPIKVHLPAVKARANVRAAIVRAGGTQRLHVQDVVF